MALSLTTLRRDFPKGFGAPSCVQPANHGKLRIHRCSGNQYTRKAGSCFLLLLPPPPHTHPRAFAYQYRTLLQQDKASFFFFPFCNREGVKLNIFMMRASYYEVSTLITQASSEARYILFRNSWLWIRRRLALGRFSQPAFGACHARCCSLGPWGLEGSWLFDGDHQKEKSAQTVLEPALKRFFLVPFSSRRDLNH